LPTRHPNAAIGCKTDFADNVKEIMPGTRFEVGAGEADIAADYKDTGLMIRDERALTARKNRH
jgi:hypothetical protein